MNQDKAISIFPHSLFFLSQRWMLTWRPFLFGSLSLSLFHLLQFLSISPLLPTLRYSFSYFLPSITSLLTCMSREAWLYISLCPALPTHLPLVSFLLFLPVPTQFPGKNRPCLDIFVWSQVLSPGSCSAAGRYHSVSTLFADPKWHPDGQTSLLFRDTCFTGLLPGSVWVRRLWSWRSRI